MMISEGLIGVFILKDKQPVKCPDILTWAEFMADVPVRTVAKDILIVGNEPVEVSTVFCGISTNFYGAPLLFETMVFGGSNSHYTVRTASWEQASIAHNQVVEQIKAGTL